MQNGSISSPVLVPRSLSISISEEKAFSTPLLEEEKSLKKVGEFGEGKQVVCLNGRVVSIITAELRKRDSESWAELKIAKDYFKSYVDIEVNEGGGVTFAKTGKKVERNCLSKIFLPVHSRYKPDIDKKRVRVRPLSIFIPVCFSLGCMMVAYSLAFIKPYLTALMVIGPSLLAFMPIADCCMHLLENVYSNQKKRKLKKEQKQDELYLTAFKNQLKTFEEAPLNIKTVAEFLKSIQLSYTAKVDLIKAMNFEQKLALETTLQTTKTKKYIPFNFLESYSLPAIDKNLIHFFKKTEEEISQENVKNVLLQLYDRIKEDPSIFNVLVRSIPEVYFQDDEIQEIVTNIGAYLENISLENLPSRNSMDEEKKTEEKEELEEIVEEVEELSLEAQEIEEEEEKVELAIGVEEESKNEDLDSLENRVRHIENKMEAMRLASSEQVDSIEPMVKLLVNFGKKKETFEVKKENLLKYEYTHKSSRVDKLKTINCLTC